MSNGESGSVLGAAVVGGTTAVTGMLANTGTSTVLLVSIGAAIVIASLLVSFVSKRKEEKTQ